MEELAKQAANATAVAMFVLVVILLVLAVIVAMVLLMLVVIALVIAVFVVIVSRCIVVIMLMIVVRVAVVVIVGCAAWLRCGWIVLIGRIDSFTHGNAPTGSSAVRDPRGEPLLTSRLTAIIVTQPTRC
jgi:hypothetical protein